MKLHLPLRLLASLLVALGVASPSAFADASYTPTSADMGNIMCVGDSITHGVSSASYRWPLFKILVDNGYNFNEVGVMTGNDPNWPNDAVVSGETVYGTKVFENVHSGKSSARAYHIAEGGNSSFFGGASIADWLGLNSEYSGSYKIDTATKTPDVYFLMIGTNDLLSDNSYNLPSVLASEQAALLGTKNEQGEWSGGYLSTIVSAMQEASGANVPIVAMTLPTWSEGRNTTNNIGGADVFNSVQQYNEALSDWCSANDIKLVDINRGVVDVAKTLTTERDGVTHTTSWVGVTNMFKQSNGDYLHPSAQGDLIIAGNIARQLGMAGRTAGQERKGTVDLGIDAAAILGLDPESVATSASYTLAADSSCTYYWADGIAPEDGYTVAFSFQNGFGDGAANEWNPAGEVFTIKLGNGVSTGTLNIDEAYIKWDNTILYSMDTSTLTSAASDEFRVAYVNGNADAGLNSGFYVWMGDMLIGEALASTSGAALNGITITNGLKDSSLVLASLAADASGAYAPSALGVTYGNPTIDAVKVETLLTDQTMPTSGSVTKGLGVTEGNAEISVSEGSASSFIINSGDYVGNIDVTLTGTVTKTGTAGKTYEGLHSAGALSGNISLTLDENFAPASGSKNWSAIYCAVHVQSGDSYVTGNVSLTISSANFVSAGKTLHSVPVAVAGSFGSTIGGKLSIVINDGNFLSGHIYGGVVYQGSADDPESIGSTYVEINGGTIGSSAQGNIYGGGVCGVIEGNTTVLLTGGATVGGTVISAGGDKSISTWDGGLIKGGTTLIIKDVDSTSNFASYVGNATKTLSGGFTSEDKLTGVLGTRTLVFNNVQMGEVNATLENFDMVQVATGSSLGLKSLGGACVLSIEGGSDLTLKAGDAGSSSYELDEVSNAGTLIIEEGVSLSAKYTGDTQATKDGAYKVQGGRLDFNDVSVAGTVEMSSGSLLGASQVNGGIYVNADGAVLLSGVDVSQLKQLETSLTECNITLENVTAMLTSSVDALAPACTVGDGATVVFAEQLTLTLDAAWTQAVISPLAATPVLLDDEARAAVASGQFLLTSGKAEAAEGLVIDISLAEGYENYAVTATGIIYDEATNQSFVTYEVSSHAVPEPAASSLSLLALAGLVARRRRRA